jgi:hypothetical protein
LLAVTPFHGYCSQVFAAVNTGLPGAAGLPVLTAAIQVLPAALPSRLSVMHTSPVADGLDRVRALALPEPLAVSWVMQDDTAVAQLDALVVNAKLAAPSVVQEVSAVLLAQPVPL